MKEKYGFVYLWYDRKHKRYYIGSHWGAEDDGYICSSSWMKRAYLRRPGDFKRRILTKNIPREILRNVEKYWLNMVKNHELRNRYYNLITNAEYLWQDHEQARKTASEKISAIMKERWKNPEYRKQRSQQTKQRYIDNPELRQRVSEKMRQQHQNNPNKLLQMSLKAKQRLAEDPEHKQRVSNERRQRWINNPMMREQMSGIKKEQWKQGVFNR